MKPQSRITIGAVVAILTIAVILIATTSKDKAPSTSPETPTASTRASQNVDRERPTAPPRESIPAPEADPTSSRGESSKPLTKEDTIEKIHDAATTYDAAYLPVIQPYLRDADPEIRQEAVDAMIILGSADAAPLLRDAAKTLTTAEEMKIMLDAAEYLELPEVDLNDLRQLKSNE